MRPASLALDTLLMSGNPLFMADLYVFTLKNGQVLAYTDCDITLNVGASTYYANGPILTREKTRVVLGLEASSMRVKASAPSNNSIMIGGYNWTTALRKGVFDGAKISVSRYIAPNSANTYGTDYVIPMFEGEVRDANASPLEVELNVVSNSYKFDTTVPLDNYAPSCVNQFGDSKCTYNRNSVTVSSTAQTGTVNSEVPCNFTIANRDSYLGGTITFTSGNNNGVVRTIKDFAGSPVTTKIFLTEPLPFPTTSESFTLRQGCNKTYTRCTQLGNQLNFRGFPFVPNPETIT
jgi:uncharacterized phage protein (TIGR02218 family)